MGGIPAPLLSFSRLSGYQQINLQVPLEVNISSGYLDVRVLRGGVASEPRRVVVAEWPALFRLPDNSGIFLRATNWSLITPAQPARPGELLITFSIGLRGQPPVPVGQPNPSEPPAILSGNLNPSISSGPHFRQGSVRRVIGAWWAPGLAGVQQIHFEAPDNYPSSGRVEVGIDVNTCMQPFPGQPTQCRVSSSPPPVILWMRLASFHPFPVREFLCQIPLPLNHLPAPWPWSDPPSC